ncbi:MAG: toll/interleukin-1 receptor domain-containing protein [Leptolyngbyaceae cyanobacterium MO_188.B28]|nr:toll/interleukin-1 receptor domain-containing protein [Leptolyngbyaceae cyanobacterium MO_188.B28]
MTSFFVSYNNADKAWAEWIAWTLEDAGHTTVIQAWDFQPGSNFVLKMQQVAAKTDKTIAVLSENYLNAEFAQPEWAAAFAEDAKSQDRKLIPIRVQDCQPSGLLKSIVYVDLIGLEEESARQTISNALPERLKPDSAPAFPKTQNPAKREGQPEFPNAPASRPWNVPYERNPFFTGREEVLQTLHQQLSQEGKAALSQTQVISGLGGIGKTQTAVEYAYRHRQDYQAVLWVRAETDQELRTGFIETARLLNLPQKDAQDSNETIQAVKRWLETHSGWLLIFDNAEHPELLTAFRPCQFQGRILLVSRAQTFDSLGIARSISLQKMPADEAVAFLFKRAGREAGDSIEQEAAATLASELDYLPLALEQAGAFILRRQLQFRTYLSQYRKQRLDLLERQAPKVGNELQVSRSVRTTWTLNFEAVKSINPASAQLLYFSAFVAPESIPYELLIGGGASLGSLLAGALAVENKEKHFIISDLLEPLSQYSLIRVDPELGSYTIHRLVQEGVKAEMNEESRHLWAERTIEAVVRAFPNAEYGNWPLCDRLLPHARAAAHYQIESEITALLLDRTGDYLTKRGRYSEVEPLFQEALAIRKRLLGDEHLSVATSLNNLALLYENQLRYSEAAPLFQQALATYKRLLGEHPAVALSFNNLASLYYKQGRYSEAAPLFQQALALLEKLLGPDHTTTKVVRGNLQALQNQ